MILSNLMHFRNAGSWCRRWEILSIEGYLRRTSPWLRSFEKQCSPFIPTSAKDLNARVIGSLFNLFLSPRVQLASFELSCCMLLIWVTWNARSLSNLTNLAKRRQD